MTFGYGKIEIPEQSMFFDHVHNDYEIIYFQEGDVDYVIGSNIYHVSKQDLLIICPGVYHYLRLRSAVPYERFIINFTPEDIDIAPTWAQEHGVFHIAKGGLIYRFFETWAETDAIFSQEEKEDFVRSGICMVFLLLKHRLQQKPGLPEHENSTLKKILAYIDDHLEESITAEQLAARFYVSTSWIVHIFRRYLGISLMQYVRKKKILYAQSLIQAGQAPTDVAVRCHFENYATFYRQYKAVVGHSPQEDKVRNGTGG